jgi:transposase
LQRIFDAASNASAVARFSPDLKVKYAQLIEIGKPVKVALTTIMRKLILLANALLKENRSWTTKIA